MEIKNVIFDLDNTLIVTGGDDVIWYKDALSNLGYNPDDYLNIYDTIDKYEDNFTEENCLYSKLDLINFLNKNLNKNYSILLIDELNKAIGEHWISKPLIQESTLQYLSSKYNLYVFTNWFKDAQWKRLENLGLSKYFKDIFSAEFYGSKPFKTSYLNVLNSLNCKANECCMIGDNKQCDILGSKNVGMKAILYDYDGKRDKQDVIVEDYIKISDLKDLEKIL